MSNLGAIRKWVVNAKAPPALPPGDSPGTHCRGGWVGPRANLYGYGEWKTSCPHREVRPRTVQPVARCYTDYALLPPPPPNAHKVQ